MKKSDNRTEAIHGGDIYRNEVRLDFSVNLNPLRIPDEIESECIGALSELRNYPDPQQQELRQAISEMDGVDPDEIICGNGASELIMAAVHAIRPAKALITAPCYAGYRVALEAADAEITEHMLKEEDGFDLTESVLDNLTNNLDIVFIGNPNNPSGRLIGPELLREIKRKCRRSGICLVIDECFLPLTEAGTAPPDEEDRALHLRAFTKSFAIPALRLGYMVCRDRELLGKIRRQLPEWNVSVMAQKAGTAAAKIASDRSGFMRESVEVIEKERDYLKRELEKMRIRVYPSDTNYLLISSRADLYDRLLGEGIMIRRCSNFSGLGESYFRIAVRNHAENEILIRTLKGIMKA